MSTETIPTPARVRLKGRRFFAWLLAWTTGIFLTFAIFGAVDTGPDAKAAMIVFGVPAILGGIGAVMLFRGIWQHEKSQSAYLQEKIVLKAAANRDGAVTIAQIIHVTPLSSSEAEEALERLCRQNLAQPELLEDGTVEYRFIGLIEQDKTPSGKSKI